ncbi:hypothetical protein CEXT_25301 [Caerostris extrusa]|uniref:Uncharacterized protein n=1 Tax=Caerostris extrusa TaxID=172846 RepID=A0AAV4T459_CAEEX|nr:hypothetical protein CEXT_25301 [Caerostris extrusa]
MSGKRGSRVISPAKEQWQIINTNSSTKSPTCDCGEEFEKKSDICCYLCNLWTEIRRKHFPSLTSSRNNSYTIKNVVYTRVSCRRGKWRFLNRHRQEIRCFFRDSNVCLSAIVFSLHRWSSSPCLALILGHQISSSCSTQASQLKPEPPRRPGRPRDLTLNRGLFEEIVEKLLQEYPGAVLSDQVPVRNSFLMEEYLTGLWATARKVTKKKRRKVVNKHDIMSALCERADIVL